MARGCLLCHAQRQLSRLAAAAPTGCGGPAERTGTATRYVDEWLRGQAAGGYVEYDPRTGTYSLTPEQAFALTDPDGAVYAPGAFELALGALRSEQKVTEAFRTGAGVGWHEHDEGVFSGCERIVSLAAVGAPAVALPGATVRMPLSFMTVPVLGGAMLRTPMPRPVYRRLLGLGLSPAAAAAAPGELLDVLRWTVRRAGNVRTVASLMHAIDSFRRPRTDSVLTNPELGQITTPTMFCWGTGDPFLAPARARPAIAKIPGAVLHEVPGGHGPWLEDPRGSAKLVISHLTATGFPPAL
jgi:pimeloyl-ACP methyl ester carboxylesterase